MGVSRQSSDRQNRLSLTPLFEQQLNHYLAPFSAVKHRGVSLLWQRLSLPSSGTSSLVLQSDPDKASPAREEGCQGIPRVLVITTVMPIIEGDPGDTKYVASDIPLTNLDHLTDGTHVCAKPDLYYGARPEQLHRQVRRQLRGLVILSMQDDLSVVPNNFVEVKGGRIAVSGISASVVRWDWRRPWVPKRPVFRGSRARR
ncbi:hypothetical protein BGZ61DRAFT_465310 [Ilyonectria robusta]|uniref:uncharacterized protein n=1 Tax=Ilyonectria robusta TaxID=1079257 RepID=UPI001E8D6983|nr:uncharacterized protein BGZ61DRAFT_465310 [Ilyonectria robusta]KAH8659395.1 hypothetical protein BGZ61DRAFT_465310 [Ilyonectria robusta]